MNTSTMVKVTPELARHLSQGSTIYHATKQNADGSPMRAKITSIKTWKKNPARIELSYKRGLYEYGKLYASELDQFLVDHDTAQNATMRANGWTTWSYKTAIKVTQLDGSFVLDHTRYSWRNGWSNGSVTKYARCKAYGSHATVCASCGNDRQSQVNDLNPFPKLCQCGSWY